mmetsp:Transcript_29946/g.30387  ORF Transcript_29946/g.30387 Transcript_29946/m.30387 type:complete len:139 (-) Transcript_29946:316-732(-)
MKAITSQMLYAFAFATTMIILESVSGKSQSSYKNKSRQAVVTLLMDQTSGFINGSLVLAQSLIDHNCTLQRVIMVTPEIDIISRKLLNQFYDQIIEVEVINCTFKSSEVADIMYDMKGPKWALSMTNWVRTCTKVRNR